MRIVQTRGSWGGWRVALGLVLGAMVMIGAQDPAVGERAEPFEIRFESDPQGLAWQMEQLEPETGSVEVIPGDAFTGVFRLRNNSARQSTVLVRHVFEPPEMYHYVWTIECGLQFTITMDPGDEEEFEGEFFLREGVPPQIKAARIVFTFEQLDEPFGSAELEKGRSIYLSRCVTCHGSEGRGDTPLARRLQRPPRDLRTSLEQSSNWRLLRSLMDGKGMMPAFSPALEENELRHVIRYLRTRWGGAG